MNKLAFRVEKESFVRDFLTPISRMGDGIVTLDIINGEVVAILMHSNQTCVFYSRYKALEVGSIAAIAIRNTTKIIQAFKFIKEPEPEWTIEADRHLCFNSNDAVIHIPLVPTAIAASAQCGLKPERIDQCAFDIEGILPKDAIADIIRAQQATDGKTVQLSPRDGGIYALITNRDVPGGDKISLRIMEQSAISTGAWTKSALLPTDIFAVLSQHPGDITVRVDQSSGRFIFMAETANTTTKYAQLALVDNQPN